MQPDENAFDYQRTLPAGWLGSQVPAAGRVPPVRGVVQPDLLS